MNPLEIRKKHLLVRLELLKRFINGEHPFDMKNIDERKKKYNEIADSLI